MTSMKNGIKQSVCWGAVAYDRIFFSIERKEYPTFTTMLINLKDILLNNVNQT